MRNLSDRRMAFTLIELLVVIAIIALLIGILLPGREESPRANKVASQDQPVSTAVGSIASTAESTALKWFEHTLVLAVVSGTMVGAGCLLRLAIRLNTDQRTSITQQQAVAASTVATMNQVLEREQRLLDAVHTRGLSQPIEAPTPSANVEEVRPDSPGGSVPRGALTAEELNRLAHLIMKLSADEKIAQRNSESSGVLPSGARLNADVEP